MDLFNSLNDPQKHVKCEIYPVEVPNKAASNSLSFAGELFDKASGRWTVLNDNSKSDVWGSPWRFVTFIETDFDDEILSHEYAKTLWEYIEFELNKNQAINYSANVAVNTEYYFGNDINSTRSKLYNDFTQTLEVRISWSITDNNLIRNLKLWDKIMHKVIDEKYLVNSRLHSLL